MIKQLEWELVDVLWYGAETAFGAYEVRVASSLGVRVRFPGTGHFQPFDGDIEAAKADAQRHFEEKVKSLLVEPAPLPQIAARFTYTNYKGETEEREVYPTGLFYGSTPYHPDQQWFLRAFDISRNADRDFALKDIGAGKHVGWIWKSPHRDAWQYSDGVEKPRLGLTTSFEATITYVKVYV